MKKYRIVKSLQNENNIWLPVGAILMSTNFAHCLSGEVNVIYLEPVKSSAELSAEKSEGENV